MAIGPVEYIIVGFPGNKFNGEIAPELGKLVDNGTIRILDLVFITKDEDGDVAVVEFEDHDDVALFNALEGEVGGLISQEDAEYAAAELEPNSSAALLIWEDLWAAPFVEAMRASGGVLIEGSRIPHDLIEAAEAAWPPADRTHQPEHRTNHIEESTPCCAVARSPEPWSRPPSSPVPPPARGTASTDARTAARTGRGDRARR